MTFRPIEGEESDSIYDVFRAAVDGSAALTPAGDRLTSGSSPFEAHERMWQHLANTAYAAWLAEDGDRVVGYARSILREDVHSLTEFFVRPEAHGRGIGAGLLARAYAPLRGSRHVVVASTDLAAVTRYLKLGLAGRFPIYNLRGVARSSPMKTDLAFEPITAADEAGLAAIGLVDESVVGHRRDLDHRFLLSDRRGFLARREGRIAGYGYAGRWCGPIAALDQSDIPPLLAHTESLSATARAGETEFAVPLVNLAALSYLLGRGYRLDSSFVRFMSDVEMGSFDRYVCTVPSLLL